MRFKIYISGQRRGVTDAIKRELRRRSAVEPVIGHAKAEHRMGRNFLKGPHGDAANAVLAAAGYNFRRLLAWLAMIWRVLSAAILAETVQFRDHQTRLTPPAVPTVRARSSRTTRLLGQSVALSSSLAASGVAPTMSTSSPADRPSSHARAQPIRRLFVAETMVFVLICRKSQRLVRVVARLARYSLCPFGCYEQRGDP